MGTSITAEIDKDGNIEVDFNGFHGDACLHEAERLTKELKSLGVSLSLDKIKRKDDFHVEEASHIHTKE